MAKKTKINNGEKDLEYYKTVALFWETYVKNIEEELAKQGKKKLVLKAMQDCLKKEPKTKTRKLCEVTGISKSTFYYNKDNDSQKLKDKEILDLLLKLPKKILRNRRSKAKAHEIKIRFGKVVNHFCCLLEFYHTFFALVWEKIYFLILLSFCFV